MKDNNFLIKNSFQRYLLPSILAILSGNVSFMADHIIAGQVLGSDALAAVSMVNPLFFLFTTAGTLICAGSSTMASVSLGKEDIPTANRLFTLASLLVLIFGGIFTLAGLLFRGGIVRLISGGGLLEPLISDFCRGLIPGAAGIIAVYLPLNYFRIKGRGNFGMLMFLIMTVLNIGLDLLFTVVMKLGMFGLGLATSISSFAAVAATLPLLFLKTGYRLVSPRDWIRTVRIIRGIAITGSPPALNNFYSVIRTWALNLLILASGGPLAAAGFAFVGSVNTLAQAVVSGIAQTVSPLVGVFYGEHDTHSIRRVISLAVKIGVAAMAVFCILIAVFSRPVCVLFGLTSARQQAITVPALTISAISLSGVMVNQILSFYYTTVGRTKIANLLTLCRGLAISVPAAVLLLKVWGIYGVWISFSVSEILTFAAVYLSVRRTLRREKELRGLLLLPPRDAGDGRFISFSVDADMDSILDSSAKINDFCESCGLNPKQSMIIGLAIEEILVLLLKHLFGGGSGDTIDVKILVRDERVTMRLRCGGGSFNPLEFYKSAAEQPGGPLAGEIDEGMGLRLILKMARQVDYTTNLGLNNIVIRL